MIRQGDVKVLPVHDLHQVYSFVQRISVPAEKVKTDIIRICFQDSEDAFFLVLLDGNWSHAIKRNITSVYLPIFDKNRVVQILDFHWI